MAHPYSRTIVCVDGSNFYYGALKGTRWKWLDPVQLFQRVLNPNASSFATPILSGQYVRVLWN